MAACKGRLLFCVLNTGDVMKKEKALAWLGLPNTAEMRRIMFDRSIAGEEDGGPGSGNFGHRGRPGLRGGSGRGGGKAYKGANKRIGSKQLKKLLESSVFSDKSLKARSDAFSFTDAHIRKFADIFGGAAYGSPAHDAYDSYCWQGDVRMNGLLRGGKPRNMDQQKEWIRQEKITRENIDKITADIAKTKLREDAFVFRGIATKEGVIKALNLNLDAAELDKIVSNPDFAESLVGYRFRDDGFVSTSIDSQVALRRNFLGGAQLVIHCPKGTQGCYFGDALRITDEREFLLQRGTEFTITGVSVVKTVKGPMLSIEASVTDQTPREVPKEMNLKFKTHNDVIEAAMSKKDLDDDTLRKTYPALNDDAFAELKKLHSIKPSSYQYDRAEIFAESLVLSGLIEPYEGAEIASYICGADRFRKVDEFDDEIRKFAKGELDFELGGDTISGAEVQKRMPDVEKKYAGVDVPDAVKYKIAQMMAEADYRRASAKKDIENGYTEEDFFVKGKLKEAKELDDWQDVIVETALMAMKGGVK